MYIPCPKTHTHPLRCTILCVCLSIVSGSSPSIVPPLFNQSIITQCIKRPYRRGFPPFYSHAAG
nr:MAG TPA: hypothetical protein [Bacteriophage sp.]